MKVLVLRTCNANMTSHHTPSFVWPRLGPVEAPDWDPDPERDCGGGLHGLARGEGDASHLSSKPDAVWQVVEVETDDGYVASKGKARFRRGVVLYSGSMVGALTWPGLMRAATTGNYAHAATTGYGAHAATTGDYANAATTGYRARAATTGVCANASASGKASIAAALGGNGRAMAGENGLLIVTYWDHSAQRYDAVIGRVGIDGIKADTWYAARDGRLVEVVP